jgi:hypothetical protein
MATVRSTWTTAPLAVDGFLTSPEWTSAGSLPIPAGFLMVKNDASSLYVALDVVGDSGNDAGTNDYFWLYVDVDRNGAPTAHRDVLFSPYPNQPDRLAKWPVLGPGVTEPISSTQVIPSTMRRGFGASPNAAAAHRIWEIRLDLAEIGVDLAASAAPPVVKVGVRVASSSPSFIFDFPPNVSSDFSHFHEIVLAMRPAPDYAGLTGIVMGGVGLIPATTINATTGLATTDPAYRLPVTNAAFGGTLDILGNNVTITSLVGIGASKFVVRHRYGATLAAANAAAWTHLRTNWANYRWDGTTYVLESFGPDATDRYPILNPAGDYSIQKLLFQWSSHTAPNGFHQFELDFFNASGTAVSAPSQRLSIFVDNTAPDARLIELYHGPTDDPIPPCGMVTMSGPADGIRVVYRAFDDEGLMAGYGVSAQWGQGSGASLAGDSYAAHAASTSWQGVASATTPLWHPPTTCAYTFSVGASGRVTNGYSGSIQSAGVFRNVTIIVPFITLKMKPAAQVTILRPFGFSGETAIAGVTPQKLGLATLPIR